MEDAVEIMVLWLSNERMNNGCDVVNGYLS
jgi:hypothetical protein